MVATRIDLVTGSRSTEVRGRPGECRGSSCTLKRNAWREGEAVEAKAREGGTEMGISSKSVEARGSLVYWAMVDRERVRIGLRRKEDARVLRRAIIEGDDQPGKRGGLAARDRHLSSS